MSTPETYPDVAGLLVGPFSADWWRRLLPPAARVWFDATRCHLGDVQTGDPRLGALFDLAMHSWAITQIEAELEGWPEPITAADRAPIMCEVRKLRRERAALAAGLGLVWS